MVNFRLSKGNWRGMFAKFHRALTPSLLMICTLSFTLCGAAACLGIEGGPKTWTQNVTIGNDAMKAGDYVAAEKAYQEAINECEKKYGEMDGRTGTCIGYLGQLYVAQQEWLKAEKIYKRLLVNKEKTEPANLPVYKEQYATIQQKIKEYGLGTDPVNPTSSAANGGAEKDKDKDKNKGKQPPKPKKH